MVERRIGSRALLAAGAALAYAGWRARQARKAIELDGRVALITGGSRGLGLVLARELARQGCPLVLCARDEQELENARRELADRGADAATVVCDVTDRDRVERMVQEAERRFGRIDLVVNNASVIQVGPLETMTPEDFERALDVNFLGTVYTTLAVLPGMRARGSGRIVNITSIGARVAVPHLLPYDAAKFAARGFSEGLRAELSGTGIAVTTVVPGLMRTGSPVNAYFKGRASREFTWFSLGDALPFTSMSAKRAARRIVRAARRGEAEVTLGWQAKALGLVHDLFPGATVDVLGRVARLLPDAGDADTRQTRGMRLHSALAPSPVTGLMNRAARENNEYGGRPEPTPRHARKAGLDGGRAAGRAGPAGPAPTRQRGGR